MALETALAAHHWDVVADRDAERTYNPMTFAELVERAPGFDWAAWAAALGAPAGALDRLVVREPDFAVGLGEVWSRTDPATIRAWLRYHLITHRAPYLPEAVVEANFDFYGRTLTGAQEVRERWKRGVSLVEGTLGEAVGQVYVARHFPPSHKERMVDLVANLVEAYRRSITGLAWMGEETRARALDKLATFNPKIGYPERWKSYDGLEVDPSDLLGNVRRSRAYEQDRELAKIGRPLDRDEWFMTPQTVNAYYNPGMNEIVFPAAILQPPFFDIEADDAVNYGGIGAVIGHEIGHGFDDQGSKYDGTGALHDWWTAGRPRGVREADRGAHRAVLGVLPRPARRRHQARQRRVHGRGEHRRPRRAGDRRWRPTGSRSAGRSPTRRCSTASPARSGCFLGWARAWREKGRDEAVLQRLATDPHSPAEFRCNGVVRNIDAFHEAFGTAPGDALWLDPAERVSIW